MATNLNTDALTDNLKQLGIKNIKDITTQIANKNNQRLMAIAIKYTNNLSAIIYMPTNTSQRTLDSAKTAFKIFSALSAGPSTVKAQAMNAVNKNYILDHVFPRVVKNNKNNRDMIQNNDYISNNIMDLIIYYSFYINSEKTLLVNISQAMLAKLKLSMDDIKKAADNNIRKDIKLCDLDKTVINLQYEATGQTAAINTTSHGILIVCNDANAYAAGIIATDYITNIANNKYYIIPSSVHELLLVPNDAFTVNDLKMMTADVNKQAVDIQDKLSDFIYMVKNGKLQIAK